MPKAGRRTKKKIESAPYNVANSKNKKGVAKKVVKKNPLFKHKKRSLGIDGGIKPKQDLTKHVRWPRYVRLQRQRSLLFRRLKVPAAINQFTKTFSKNNAAQVIRLLNKYRPETQQAKRQRLRAAAQAKADGKTVEAEKPILLTYGLNEVTSAIEQNRAKLVVIAHDVEPLELVVWLPALCRKKGVSYCIIKGKARLGQVVHKKTCAAVALTEVRQEDMGDFSKLTSVAKNIFNDNYDKVGHGGLILSKKTKKKLKKRSAALAAEQ